MKSAPSAQRELFVYYGVRADGAAAAWALVRRLQAQLCRRHAGLEARLLRRADAQDGLQTWMETYAAPGLAGGVSLAWQQQIEAAAAALLAGWFEGLRHVEVFELARHAPAPNHSASAISTCSTPASSNVAPSDSKPARR